MYRLNSEGKVVFNYEPLIIDIYTYLWKDINGYDDIEDIYGNIEELMENPGDDISKTGSTGTDSSDKSFFVQYLKDRYNVNCKLKTIPYYPFLIDYKKLLNSAEKDYQSMIISCSGYDLYSVDSETGERGEKVYDNGGGHAMTITGITPKGDFVVSSWGKQYIVDVEHNNWCYFHFVDIDV